MAGSNLTALRGGLVRCFAEFARLPDLLHAYRPDTDVLAVWVQTLDEIGYNADHVEDRYIPDGMTLTAFMAADALRFCHWIHLIGPRGALTQAGRAAAQIGNTPLRDRDEGHARRLSRLLAGYIQAYYRGADNLPLTDLLQSVCAAMASYGRNWPPALGGLLLAEMDTLLHWGFEDAVIAERLGRRMPVFRNRVMAALAEVSGSSDDGEAVTANEIAQATTEYHWRNPTLAQSSELTPTELKATAIALSFSQLLSHTHTVSPPVQVLRPWVRSEYGG